MKKIVLTLFFFSLLCNSYAEEKKIEIHRQSTNQSGHTTQRSPILIPTVYIDDHTLLFNSSYSGCTIELRQDDTVLYSAIINDNGEVVLPEYLTGEYVIYFYVGSLTFAGEIQLY